VLQTWNFTFIPFPLGGRAVLLYSICTDKKENKIFHIYKEMVSGAVAKSYMRRPLVIYEKYGFATAPL
jgi:hypothetical protein